MKERERKCKSTDDDTWREMVWSGAEWLASMVAHEGTAVEVSLVPCGGDEWRRVARCGGWIV